MWIKDLNRDLLYCMRRPWSVLCWLDMHVPHDEEGGGIGWRRVFCWLHDRPGYLPGDTFHRFFASKF